MNNFDILIAILLVSLSSARIARLIVHDSIMQPFRNLFTIDIDGEVYMKPGLLPKLIHCTWCIGFWITVLFMILYLLTDWFIIVTLVLSAAQLQGLFNSWEGE